MRTSKDICRDVIESVFLEEHARKLNKRRAAEKAALAKNPPKPKPVAPPPVDPLSVLDAHMGGIDRVHAEAEARARKEYVALLVTLAPPRAGPAPAPEAHALATPSSAPVPSPEQILAVLHAVGRSRDDLRKDVAILTIVREKADLLAEGAGLEADEKAAREEVKKAVDAFEDLEAEWHVKVAALRQRQSEAEGLAQEIRATRVELESLQGVTNELRAIKLPTINDRARATPSELAAEAEAKKAQQAVHEKAARLGALECVFFPPEQKTR